MSNQERAEILDALKSLSEADKQFMLGFAAGRSASTTPVIVDSNIPEKINSQDEPQSR